MAPKLIYKLLDEKSLLDRLLNSQSPAEPWAEFLRRYSNLFFKVIWQHERDHDAAVEKYLFVCTKFAENDFARLRKFRTEYGTRAPKLSTWLVSVTRNLCIDAHRAAHGRRRYPAALLRMSEFERDVFRLYYWEGYSIDEIQHMLERRNGSESVPDALDRIHNSIGLRPRRGERPTQVPPEFVRFDDNVHVEHTHEIEDGFSEDNPDWLTVLEEQERLVVRLRFWEDMAAREIVEVLDLQSEQQVYSIMHNALEKLRAHASNRKGNTPDVRAIQAKRNKNASH